MPNLVGSIAKQDKSEIRDKFERLGTLCNWSTARDGLGYSDTLVNYTWVAFIEALIYKKAANDD